jgi:hypothetical protein
VDIGNGCGSAGYPVRIPAEGDLVTLARSLSYPHLTTIRQPIAAMVECAARLLELDGPKK